MSKFTAGLSALALLVSVPALAQDQVKPDMNAKPEVSVPEVNANPPAHMKDSAATKRSAEANLVGEYRASKLLNTTVYNDKNESIGDINDFLLTNDGRIASVIVGIGGFLGMGERNVALDFADLQFAHDGKGAVKISTALDKSTLAAKPEWQPITR